MQSLTSTIKVILLGVDEVERASTISVGTETIKKKLEIAL
jgi:hypothetical protein